MFNRLFTSVQILSIEVRFDPSAFILMTVIAATNSLNILMEHEVQVLVSLRLAASIVCL